jgi:hypothetical protein
LIPGFLFAVIILFSMSESAFGKSRLVEHGPANPLPYSESDKKEPRCHSHTAPAVQTWNLLENPAGGNDLGRSGSGLLAIMVK